VHQAHQNRMATDRPTTQKNSKSEKFDVDLEDKEAVKHFREMEMVDDETPEGIRDPTNYKGNYEEVQKTEKIEIEDEGVREINQFTKFQSYHRSRSGSLSSESETKDLYLVKIRDGEAEIINLQDLRPERQRKGVDKSQYHDLQEQGIRKKVNWSKGGIERGESGSGCNYLIQRKAVENCDEAFILKHHYKQGGSVNGSYNKDEFKLWELKVAE